MGTTKIEWCDKTWSPVTGCTPISEGCTHCWAKRMVNRLKGRYGYPKDDPFKVTFHPDRLEEPLHWKKPSRLFVCSIGDIFHDDVDGFWLSEIWSIIERSYWHTFLILTKRPERWKQLTPQLPVYKNLWLGVSISTNKDLWMVENLLQIPAVKRFVSVEPILGEITLHAIKEKEDLWHDVLRGETIKGKINGFASVSKGVKLDWVICGCESGLKRRKTEIDWIRNLRDQCSNAAVPFFLKQMEVNGKLVKMPKLDGKKWREFPNGD